MPELPKGNGELFFLFFSFSFLFCSVFVLFFFNKIDYKASNRTWFIHFTFLLNEKLMRSKNFVPQHTRLQKLLKRCTVANYNHPAKDVYCECSF